MWTGLPPADRASTPTACPSCRPADGASSPPVSRAQMPAASLACPQKQAAPSSPHADCATTPAAGPSSCPADGATLPVDRTKMLGASLACSRKQAAPSSPRADRATTPVARLSSCPANGDSTFPRPTAPKGRQQALPAPRSRWHLPRSHQPRPQPPLPLGVLEVGSGAAPPRTSPASKHSRDRGQKYSCLPLWVSEAQPAGQHQGAAPITSPGVPTHRNRQHLQKSLLRRRGKRPGLNACSQ